MPWLAAISSRTLMTFLSVTGFSTNCPVFECSSTDLLKILFRKPFERSTGSLKMNTRRGLRNFVSTKTWSSILLKSRRSCVRMDETSFKHSGTPWTMQIFGSTGAWLFWLLITGVVTGVFWQKLLNLGAALGTRLASLPDGLQFFLINSIRLDRS